MSQPTLALEELLVQIFREENRAKIITTLVEFLCSPQGKNLIRRALEDSIQTRPVKVSDWAQRFATPEPGPSSDLTLNMRAVLESMSLGSLKGQAPLSAPSAGELPSLAAGIALVKNLVGQGKLPSQLLEVLDNVGYESSDGLLANLQHCQGAIAAIVGLVVSSAIHTNNYYHGQIRWDDAVDRVAGDALKAGITGVLVSNIATGLGFTGPGALALAVPIAVVVYSTVSAVCDWVYEEWLGGREIRCARRVHADYLDLAEYIRREYYPRLKRVAGIGALVECLSAIREGDKTELIGRAEGALHAVVYEKPSSQQFVRAGDQTFEKQLDGYLKYNSLVGRPHLSPEEIKYYATLVHKLFWDFKQREPNRKNAQEIVNEVLIRAKTAPGKPREAIRKLTNHFVELEESRHTQDSPLRFWVGELQPLGEKVDYLAASNVFELVSFVHALVQRDGNPDKPLTITGCQDTRMLCADDDLPTFLTAEPKGQKSQYEKTVLPRYQKCLQPHDKGLTLNPFYRRGLCQEIRSGLQRVFGLPMAADHPGKHEKVYICVAREVDEEQQQVSLQRSLRRYHPFLRRYSDAIRRMHKLPADLTGEEAVLISMGLRLIPLDLYTGTFKVTDGENRVQYVFHEGYFNSLKEAFVGFRSWMPMNELVGVRPGGKVITDTVREKLRTAERQDFWPLQNALLARISDGLILLDDLANRDEEATSRLAGSGALVSYWWFLSGHTRRALIASLCEQTTQKALRMELMESLLHVHRLHILNSGFFAEQAPVNSVLLQEAEKAAIERAKRFDEG